MSKKIINVTCLIIMFFGLLLIPTFAQDDHTIREEREGKVIWEKLQAKKITCDKLSDEDFERVGEYYMGQMHGERHEAMNKMMAQMMGEKGEEQMHVNLGKKFSGCGKSAVFPQQGFGFMPMIGMMGMMTPLLPTGSGFAGQEGGEWLMMGYGGWNNMMGGWGGGFGFFALMFWLFWLVLLVDLILVGVWLWKKIKKEK